MVWKPPDQLRVISCEHLSHREKSEALDSERVGIFRTISRHLWKSVLPIFESLHFRLAYRMLPVWSSFWFLNQIKLDIIFCTQPFCAAAESDQYLFLECDRIAQVWMDLRLIWDPFLSSRPRWTYIACESIPSDMERLSEKYFIIFPIYGLHCTRWHWTLFRPIRFVASLISDQQLRQFQHIYANCARSVILKTVLRSRRTYIQRSYVEKKLGKFQNVIKSVNKIKYTDYK